MAEKYKVELNLPNNENGSTTDTGEITLLLPQQAAFIPRSVRMEVKEKGGLPDA